MLAWCVLGATACAQVARLDAFSFADSCIAEGAAAACQGKACGPAIDNCGSAVICPNTCAAPDTCGGGGDPDQNQCGCTPVPLAVACQGLACGPTDDKCGHLLTCPNTCTGVQTCGGGGAGRNQCGCTSQPPADTCKGVACGEVADHCGLMVACPNTCAAPDTCGKPGPNQCGCAVTQNCAAKQACVNGVCKPARTVFLSTTGFSGNIGGLSGADASCQTLALKAGLAGTFKAWLSDSMTSAATRLSHSSDPYRLIDGTLVANDWTHFSSGALAHAISRFETGSEPTATEAWTGSGPDGSQAAVGCNDWTSGSHLSATPNVGLSTGSDATWTNAYLQFCDHNDVHLYCVEQ